MVRNMNSKRKRNVVAFIFGEAGWKCEMPKCLAPTRDMDPELQGTNDPWAPTIDHIIPVSQGGSNSVLNMRAAHRQCNNEAGGGGRLRQKIGHIYPDLLFLAEEIVRNN